MTRKLISIFCLLVLFGFGLLVEVCVAESDQAVRELGRIHYLRARYFYRQREYDQAAREFRKVLKILPQHQGARWYLKYIKQELAGRGEALGARSKKPARRKDRKGYKPALEKYAEETSLRVEKAQRRLLEKEKSRLLREKKSLETKVGEYKQQLEKQKRQSQEEEKRLKAQAKEKERQRQKQEAEAKRLAAETKRLEAKALRSEEKANIRVEKAKRRAEKAQRREKDPAIRFPPAAPTPHPQPAPRL